MKIRTNYVSNSSSSSYIIAVDEKFFGSLEVFYRTHSIGFDTSLSTVDNATYRWWEPDDEYDDYAEVREQIKKCKDSGMEVYSIHLDYDHCYLVDMLQQISNQNGGDKLTIIYGENE